MSGFPGWTKKGKGSDSHQGLWPLGMESVGGWFVNQLMPGITNGTLHARYYSFFSWVFWTFDQLVRQGVLPSTASAQKQWLVRMENIFRFATVYAAKRDDRATTGLIGIDKAQHVAILMDDPEAPIDVGREFAASAYIPAAYKASFTALGCAESHPDHTELTLGTGLPLGRAFHAAVAEVPGADRERDILLSASEVIPARVLYRLGDALRLRGVSPGEPEHPLLVNLLFRTREERRNEELRVQDRSRLRSFALLLDILHHAEAPLVADDFHWIFSSALLPSAQHYAPPASLSRTWSLWSHYQEREYEKVAVYGFLKTVVELIREQRKRRLPVTTRSLVEPMIPATERSPIFAAWLGGDLASWTVGAAQEQMLARWDPSGQDPDFSIEGLSEIQRDARDRGDITAGSLILFLLITARWNRERHGHPEWVQQLHETGGVERLSLSTASADTRHRAGMALPEFLSWLIETYVISQSFRVAVDKLAGGDYRFFIGMGDDGYEIVKEPVDGRTYYPTRIRSAFEMMLDLDLLREEGDTGMALTAEGEAMRGEALSALRDADGATVAA